MLKEEFGVFGDIIKVSKIFRLIEIVVEKLFMYCNRLVLILHLFIPRWDLL